MSWFRAWGRALLFAYTATAAALSLSAYTARTRAIATRHVYAGAWRILPRFTVFTSVLSFVVIDITVGLARQYGLAQFALQLVVRGIVLEVVPMLTALYVALRSGAAMAVEMAQMRASGALDSLGQGDLEPYEREFVPRIAATAISVFTLTVVSCSVVMVIAYIALYGASPWGFAEFTRAVARIFSPLSLLAFALKCFVFGVVVAVVPIAAGLEATHDAHSVPQAVMGGMVRLFVALALIELASLAVKYA